MCWQGAVQEAETANLLTNTHSCARPRGSCEHLELIKDREQGRWLSSRQALEAVFQMSAPILALLLRENLWSKRSRLGNEKQSPLLKGHYVQEVLQHDKSHRGVCELLAKI